MTDETNAAAPEAAVSDEALWAEFRGKQDAGSASDVSQNEPEPQTADDPAHEPDPDQPDAADAAPEGEAKAAPVDKDAEIERLKRENEEARHKLNSSRGRISALTRKLNSYDAARRNVDAATADTPDANRIKEEFPEIAALTERQREATKAAISIEEQAAREELQGILDAQAAEFLQVQPDGLDVLNRHADKVQNYLTRDDAPVWVLRAWQENEKLITNAASAARLVEDFKRFVGESQPETPAPSTQPQLSDKRKRQLDGASGPSGTVSRPVASGIPKEGTDQEIWNAFMRMRKPRA